MPAYAIPVAVQGDQARTKSGKGGPAHAEWHRIERGSAEPCRAAPGGRGRLRRVRQRRASSSSGSISTRWAGRSSSAVELSAEGKLGFWRWAGLFFGVAGSYRAKRHGRRRLPGGRTPHRAEPSAHPACLNGLVASLAWPASSSHARGGSCCPTGSQFPLFLIALTALSAFLRTRALNAGFWIDEGLSVGIAHHHWSSIPRLLRQDGSPPGYYLLLGLWIRLFGDGERATHTLSLLFGLACIPVAYAAARTFFDRKTGLICATLAAFDPFLTYYAQETRMYEVEALLSIVVAYAYVQGVLRGRQRLGRRPRRRHSPSMVYVHNWALFLCVGLAAATVLCARRRLKRFALVAAGVALLYLPWVPIVLSQVRHTGAPWSTSPGLPRSRACARRGGQRRRRAGCAGAGRRRRAARARAVAGGRRRAHDRAGARDGGRGDRPPGLALVAGLAGLDDALLRGRARPGARWSARAGSRGPTGAASRPWP